MKHLKVDIGFPDMELAACKDAPDPDVFFHESDRDGNNILPGVSNANMKSYKTAKAMCIECPITLQCLLVALKDKVDYGIWGGATPEMRKKMRKQKHVIKFLMELKESAPNTNK